MPERFAKIESSSLRERSLEERLKAYPELKAKIEAMLSIIENSGGDVEKAAEAERRMIEEWRQMGNEVLHRWARRQQQKKEEEHNAQPGVNRQEKKALLVQTASKNRPRGGGLHPRTLGAGDPTLFPVGGGPLPGVGLQRAGSPRTLGAVPNELVQCCQG